MPWIPYIYDSYVMVGIGALWAVGFVIWGMNARKRRRPIGSFVGGLVLAAAGLFACLIVYGIYIIARQDYEGQDDAACRSHLKFLNLALLQYAQKHKNHLPPANVWATDIGPYLDKSAGQQVFHCPDAQSPYSYEFNQALGGLSLDSLAKPSDTVMLFEADAKTINASGTAADFVTTRHLNGGYCTFADGHFQIARSAAGLNWKP